MGRTFVASLLAVLVILGASAGSSQEKVIVSHTTRGSLSIGPLLYGIERGFYRDEGIDLLYVSIRADLGIKTLITGDVDYLYSVGTIIRGAVLGLPVKTLSFDFARVMHFLMARPEITSAAMLKGKRVGVSSFGATGDLAARVALQSIGLDPTRDVSIVTLGSDTLRYAALQAGTVHATHMPLPFNIQMKKDGYRELFYAGKVLQRPLTGLATTTEKLKKNPRQVQRMVRAFLRTTRALKSERNEFLAFAQKKFGFTKDVLEEAYKVMTDALSNDGIVEDGVLQSAIDEAKAVANVTKPVSHADVVDYSFLREAIKR
jgi:ABC-type nitrate/sulfonate/bicarbonate transport system substrate-binding protein